MPDFCHLHCHTQYSLLDGASDIPTMMDKAKQDGQKAVALTDHGNMFGAFSFVHEAKKRDMKPIVGCEFYLVEDRHKKSFSRKDPDKRYHQLMLAKNQEGYRNLSKLCSLGFIDGLYNDFPRIDRELIDQYQEGLIATSCCIAAEIPQAILHGHENEAEEKLKWWLERFGDDFYIELQRHSGMEDIDGTGRSQEYVNQVLLKLAEKHDVKTIATNDSHYIDEQDSKIHDILLCINTGSRIDEENRFRFSSDDYYFKTQDEMSQLFSDVPEAIDHTMEINDKVETLDLAKDVLLPAYPLPDGFDSQQEYLRHLTFQGAKRRYGEITEELRERLDFELQVIEDSGYPGYFLIVQDFTSKARELGVSVGPGRGSAAGSAVAYCIGITNVDPIKYDLLFERFLNPERISMPDIDIDFDDEGRSKIIDYVIEKYGHEQVAQIITYGSMAAKLSIRDVGRVLDLDLSEVDRITKNIPSHAGASLKAILNDQDNQNELENRVSGDDYEKLMKVREWAQRDDKVGETLRTAKELEGNIRNRGIHPCGIVITPGPVTDYVPVSTTKDSDLLISQYDVNVAEKAGLLKMDFLGLRTLSIINAAVENVKKTRNLDIDIENVPLDDEKTYELFQRGDTIGIFQYESAGMRKYLKQLKPNKFEDLIAMNALYRPGPMKYIPNFIDRKLGKEEIEYDLPEMEEYLSETYGITVYQEQVMLLSQKLAGFSKGQADKLRKGMGKKKKEVIDELYPKFIKGCEENGHPREVVEKIWDDWESFASYAFNKSHSTCYALVAYQTAYLKANYPSEFMAAVLTHNKSDISKVNFFLRECKKQGIELLGPDVNESGKNFSVTEEGNIRMGLAAIKGVGEGPVEAIEEERTENGRFETIFDMMRRVDLSAVNKKCMESLAKAGALDSVAGEEIHRAQFFGPSGKYDSFISHLIKYGNGYQSQQAQLANSLFGGTDEVLIEEPDIPDADRWNELQKLELEKEVTGIYVSGHPLDMYRMEIKNFTDCPIRFLKEKKLTRTTKIAGIVTDAFHGTSKKGTDYCRFTVQDYQDSLKIGLYREDYRRYGDLVKQGQVLFIEGKYKERYNGDGHWFNVESVRLLESIGKEMTKSITVQLTLQSLSQEQLEAIDQLTMNHKGKHAFKLNVVDAEEEMGLPMVSSGRKVDVDQDFIDELERLGIPYRLNA